jgi:hypothetical protein
MRHHTLLARRLVSLLAACACAAPLAAQARFATTVLGQSTGAGGGGIYNAANALGAPQGGGLLQGSLHVHTLGIGGTLTLELGVAAVDGPGCDLVVYENGFQLAGTGLVFTEGVHVEVASNGVDYARLPGRYQGPVGGFAGAPGAPWGVLSGVAGGVPVLANSLTNAIDPWNPVVAGGDCFDLAELASHPLVLAGSLDLGSVRQVRLVDVVEGVALDSQGALLWDNSGPFGSADIDAVAVVQTASTVAPGQPRADLSIDAFGHLVLELTDPDGFGDLVQSQCKASWNLVPISLTRLRGLLPQVTTIQGGVRMRSATPIQGSGRKATLAVSVVDASGLSSVDQIALQG